MFLVEIYGTRKPKINEKSLYMYDEVQLLQRHLASKWAIINNTKSRQEQWDHSDLSGSTLN